MRYLLIAVLLFSGCVGPGAVGTDRRVYDGQHGAVGSDTLHVGPAGNRQVRVWCIEDGRSVPHDVHWSDDETIVFDCGAWSWWHVEVWPSA